MRPLQFRALAAAQRAHAAAAAPAQTALGPALARPRGGGGMGIRETAAAASAAGGRRTHRALATRGRAALKNEARYAGDGQARRAAEGEARRAADAARSSSSSSSSPSSSSFSAAAASVTAAAAAAAGGLLLLLGGAPSSSSSSSSASFSSPSVLLRPLSARCDALPLHAVDDDDGDDDDSGGGGDGKVGDRDGIVGDPDRDGRSPPPHPKPQQQQPNPVHLDLPPDVVHESDTQVPYPRSLSASEQLMGVGVRLMTPLKIQVYTIGLYVDAQLAPSILQHWRGAGPEFDPAFWTELSSPSSPLPRTLRMKVVREVSGKHMQNGFDRALIPRVGHAATTLDLPGGKDALRRFNAVFKTAGILKIGTEICIKFPGYDTLVLEINGRHFVTVHNKALVWAVLDMFLGESSVAPNVKARIGEAFHDLLSSVPT